MPTPPELTVESALKGVKQTEAYLRAAKVEFEAAITAAKIEAGASYAQIAEAAGLTRSGVQAVLRRQLR